MKRTLSLILCGTVCLSLFAGCGTDREQAYVPTGHALVMEGEDPNSIYEDQEKPPQEFSLVYYDDRSMNPIKSMDFTNRALFSLIYQGLFSVDSSYNPVPILCNAFQISPDNRTYTFYLEPEAAFSDGTPVTPSDVLATYTAARDSNYYSGRFTHITEITLTDDNGITFSLDTPYENLPLLLDIPIVKAGEVEADFPLGSGPYTLQNSLTGAQLRKLPSWWCQKELLVYADSIPLVSAQSPAHIRDQFEFHDVGLVCANPCSDSYADFRCDYELWDLDNGIFLYLGSNVNWSKDEFFKESTVRSVLTYAIDRQKLVDDHYRGLAKPVTLPASPLSPYYSPSLAAKYEYDPMKFIEVMRNVKLPEEPLELLVTTSDSVRLRVARDIAQMLSESGLPTVTVELEINAYNSRLLNGQYDLYLGATKLSPNMDLSAFFRPWGTLSYNGMTDAPIYNKCLAALENHGNYYNLHQMVADDGRVCPLLFTTYAVYATRGLLTDLTPSRDNVFFYALDKSVDSIQIATNYDTEA